MLLISPSWRCFAFLIITVVAITLTCVSSVAQGEMDYPVLDSSPDPKILAKDKVLIQSLNSPNLFSFYRVPAEEMIEIVKRASSSHTRAVDIVILILQESSVNQGFNGSYARVSLVEVMKEAAAQPEVISVTRLQELGLWIGLSWEKLTSPEDVKAIHEVRNLYVNNFVLRYARHIFAAKNLDWAVEFLTFLSNAGPDNGPGLEWISAHSVVYEEARRLTQQAVFNSVPAGRREALAELYDVRDKIYPNCTQAATVVSGLYEAKLLPSDMVRSALRDFAASSCITSWESDRFLVESTQLCQLAKERADTDVFEACRSNLVTAVIESIFDLAADPRKVSRREALKKALQVMVEGFEQ